MPAPYEVSEWGEAPAVYDDHTLKILGREVMEDWETPYMERLGGVAAQNGGAVLELGYGMGISSTAIQSHDVENYTVIEAHPDVLRRCVDENRDAINAGRMCMLGGYWQNVTPLLKDNSFDGILFDTYPIKKEEMIGPHMLFFNEAFRLLRPKGVLTYYSDEATTLQAPHVERLAAAGFRKEDIDFEVCEVTPPQGCEYWEEPTIVVPIIRKSQG